MLSKILFVHKRSYKSVKLTFVILQESVAIHYNYSSVTNFVFLIQVLVTSNDLGIIVSIKFLVNLLIFVLQYKCVSVKCRFVATFHKEFYEFKYPWKSFSNFTYFLECRGMNKIKMNKSFNNI